MFLSFRSFFFFSIVPRTHLVTGARRILRDRSSKFQREHERNAFLGNDARTSTPSDTVSLISCTLAPHRGGLVSPFQNYDDKSRGVSYTYSSSPSPIAPSLPLFFSLCIHTHTCRQTQHMHIHIYTGFTSR